MKHKISNNILLKLILFYGLEKDFLVMKNVEHYLLSIIFKHRKIISGKEISCLELLY
jgi:hypothetical protein